MNKTSSSWQNDPITKLGLINLFTNMQLTLFIGYLPIYLTNNIVVTIIIFTIIISSLNFFQIFLRIPMGSLSQTIGRKPSILLGNIFVNLALFFLFIANSYFFVFLSALLAALGMSSYWPASFSYIQDCDAKNYGKNNGRLFKLGDVGILLGALFAKIFLDQFLLGLRLFFFSLSTIGFIATLLFIVLLPESLENDHRVHITIKSFINENFIKMISKFKGITTYPGMKKIYFFQMTLAFAEYFMAIFFPLLIDSDGYSTGTLGAIIFLGTFLLLWLKPYLGSVSDRYGYRSPLLFGFTSIAVAFLITPLLKGLIVLVILYIFVYIFIFIGYPSVNSATASTAPAKQRGLALGALGVYTSLGRTTSTIIMSPIWNIIKINDTFVIAGLLLLTLVFILYFTTKQPNEVLEAKKIDITI